MIISRESVKVVSNNSKVDLFSKFTAWAMSIILLPVIIIGWILIKIIGGVLRCHTWLTK